MGRRKAPDDSNAATSQTDTDSDRFPTVKKCLQAIVDDPNTPDYQTDYLQIRAQANGEVTWRIREARGEEIDVGLVS